jgi:hypothetical protein
MPDLINKIKKKPIRYSLQAFVATGYIKLTIDAGLYWMKNIDKCEPQIRDAIGYIGYWTGQIGIPLLTAGATAGVGCLATIGVGLAIDKYWYSEKNL